SLFPWGFAASRGTFAMVSVLQQLSNPGIFDWAWIVVRILRGQLRGTIQTIGRHANVLESERSAEPRSKVIHTLGSVADSKRVGRDAHCFRRRIPVEVHRVRKDDRMRLCMGQIERSTQRVAKLVMNGHADVSQNCS